MRLAIFLLFCGRRWFTATKRRPASMPCNSYELCLAPDLEHARPDRLGAVVVEETAATQGDHSQQQKNGCFHGRCDDGKRTKILHRCRRRKRTATHWVCFYLLHSGQEPTADL